MEGGVPLVRSVTPVSVLLALLILGWWMLIRVTRSEFGLVLELGLLSEVAYPICSAALVRAALERS